MATLVVAITTRSANLTFTAELVAGVLAPAIGFVIIQGEYRRAFRHPLLLRVFRRVFFAMASVHVERDWSRRLSSVEAKSSCFSGTIFRRRRGYLLLRLDWPVRSRSPWTVSRSLSCRRPQGSWRRTDVRTDTGTARSIRVASVLATFTLAIAIPVVYTAIPLLFGPGFAETRTPFLVLGVVSCLQSVALPLSMLVFATRNAGSVLHINLACVSLDAGSWRSASCLSLGCGERLPQTCPLIC